MLGYFDMFLPSGNPAMYRIIFGFVGVGLALMTMTTRKKTEAFKKQIRFVNRFMMLYVPIILISAVFSVIWYEYKLSSILALVMPYFYAAYAYPLVYIFSRDKTHEKYMKFTVGLVVGILLIKAFAWYMYNYKGTTLFPNLLLQHSDEWVRNGVLRVDVCYLYGIAVCFLVSSFFVKKKLISAVLAGGLILYVVFITQYRYLVITVLLSVLLVYLTSSATNKSQVIRSLVFTLGVILFIAFGGLDAILASFSVENKDYGSSNEARILTIVYFWDMMKGIQYVIGVGFISGYSAKALALITRSSTLTYWLEDIGIIGGIFRFGLLSFLIYVPLFYQAIRESVYQIRHKLPDRAFLTSMSGYMIVVCMMLNIFDTQRLYDVAFYLALISYLSAKKEEEPKSPLLLTQHSAA